MTTLQQLLEGQANAHVAVNENFDAVSAAAIFARNPATSVGLTWGYYGGLYAGNTTASGTFSLADNADNWIVVLRSTGVVSHSTSNTNAVDVLYAAIYKVTTLSGVVTTIVDLRMDDNGLLSVPINSDLTAVIADLRTVPRRTSALATGECLATAGDVAVTTFPAGSLVSIFNNSGSSINITESGVTIRKAGTATTGDRTLAQRGLASLWFNTTTEAIISGPGVA